MRSIIELTLVVTPRTLTPYGTRRVAQRIRTPRHLLALDNDLINAQP